MYLPTPHKPLGSGEAMAKLNPESGRLGVSGSGLRCIAVKKVKQRKFSDSDDEEGEEEAMTPKGAIFCNPCIDCYILVIIGLIRQVHLPSLKAALQSTLVKHKRFSSIVRKDKRGNCKWVEKELDIDEHIIEPDLSPSYTQRIDFVEEYVSSLATERPLDRSRPLWQIHVLNHNSSAGVQASVVFRIHHCIGDCASLMSLFLDSTRKVTQPQSKPTAGPIHRPSKHKWTMMGLFQAIWTLIFVLWITIKDLLHVFATLLWLKDSKILRRDRGAGIPHPKRLAQFTVDLNDVAIVRNAVNGTVNDVVIGMLSAGFGRFLNRRQECMDTVSNLRLRTLVPVNMRSASSGLVELDYMKRNPKEARWGNEFSTWIFPIRLDKHDDDPLEYCRVARSISQKKKASFEATISFFFVGLLSRVFGVNLAMYLTYRVALNTTLVFSNVLGPVEEVQLVGNPVKHIITTVSWLPQPLVIHFQSYAGKAKLAVLAEEDVVPNPHQLCTDCAHALQQMKQAALVAS
eukprot:Gb_17842 [translate_table: standard]